MHKNYKINIVLTPLDEKKLDEILTGTGKVRGGVYSRIKKLIQKDDYKIDTIPEFKKRMFSFMFEPEEWEKLNYLAKREGISIPRLIEKYVIIPILVIENDNNTTSTPAPVNQTSVQLS